MKLRNDRLKCRIAGDERPWPPGLSPCRDRSYARRPSFPTTLLSSDLTLTSTDITPLQVDITPLQGGIGSLAIDPTPLPTAMGLMSLGLTAAQVDVARLSIDLILPSIGSTQRSTVSDRLSPDITTPSFDRTMWQPVLTVFASGRSSSGGEPGRGPTAGGRPGAGKLCSLPFSSHKEVGMSRFPRTEAEITAVYAQVMSTRNVDSATVDARHCMTLARPAEVQGPVWHS